MILYLEFTAFDLDFDPVLCDLNCNCDHLTITDGDGTTLMGKSCGSTSSATHTSMYACTIRAAGQPGGGSTRSFAGYVAGRCLRSSFLR